MSKSLPSRPNLEQLKNQAKDLLKQFLADEPAAVARVREFHPDFGNLPPESWKQPLTPSLSPSDGERVSAGRVRGRSFRLHDAQLIIAREYGFASWTRLKEHVESILLESAEPLELLKRAFHAN